MFRYELSKPEKMERLEVDPSVEGVRPHVIGNQGLRLYFHYYQDSRNYHRTVY